MSVILFILKLIVSLLLALLGIVILVLLLVLFLPVHYHVSGESVDEITVHAKVTWLLHLISFVIDYQDGEMTSCLRILGIRKKAKEKSALDEEAWADEPDIEPQLPLKTEIVREPEETEKAAETEGVDNPSERRIYRKSPFARMMEQIRSFFDMIGTRIQAFFEAVHKLMDVIPKMRKQVSGIKNFIMDEATKGAVSAVFSELGYLLKHFKFRKLVTDLRFSTGDPATTGQALGVLCMFPILYQYQVSIVPDFESEEFYVKGTFEIKGHLRVVHLVVTLVRLWKKREVRIFVKKLLDK